MVVAVCSLLAVTTGFAVALRPTPRSSAAEAAGSHRSAAETDALSSRPYRLVPPARATHQRTPAAPVPAWASTLLARDVPARSGQAIIVRAPSMSSTTNTVSLWTRTAAGWRQTGSLMPGHNGERGWSAHRTSGDLKTPTGVYTLTAAGGRLPNPGTQEPYEHSEPYFHTAGHFLGHNTFGVFNYVVAIDFNRVAGSPVTSTKQPWGPRPGGDIWLHVDNGAPTLGCVTVAQPNMATILKWLDPSQHPVIVLKAG